MSMAMEKVREIVSDSEETWSKVKANVNCHFPSLALPMSTNRVLRFVIHRISVANLTEAPAQTCLAKGYNCAGFVIHVRIEPSADQNLARFLRVQRHAGQYLLPRHVLVNIILKYFVFSSIVSVEHFLYCHKY